MIILETEHVGFDFPTLRHSLLYLLNRKRIAEKGTLQPDMVPLVRILLYTRERNKWVIKQTRDAGPYGLVLPHFDSVEGARSRRCVQRAIRKCPGWPILRPKASVAPNYWGLSPQEYYDAADVWPLDPDGELLLMDIVENVRGINNLPDILRQVKGIGAIWAGPGDLSISMGLRGQSSHPDVEAALLKILGICKDHGIPCAVGVSPTANAETRVAQGFQIVMVPPARSLEALLHGRQATGR